MVEEFNDFLARDGRPVVVVNGRTLEAIQGRVSPGVRGQQMFILRDGSPWDGGRARR